MSMAFDPNSYGGFTPSGDIGDPIGAQALLRRRQKASGGGMDQSAFQDPTGFFFNSLVQQLANPPMTPGGEAGYGPGNRNPNPWLRAPVPDQSRPNMRVETDYKKWGGNTAAPGLSYGENKVKAGYFQSGAGIPALNFVPTGTMAPAPDFTKLIDMSNQAFGGVPNGDFGALLGGLQKDIASGQYAAGTFESQAGAAAGGAAGAALMARLQGILAPHLVAAAQVPQGYNYNLMLGNNRQANPFGVDKFGNFDASAPFVKNSPQQTVLQSLAARAGGAQLNTNTVDQGGYSYAR